MIAFRDSFFLFLATVTTAALPTNAFGQLLLEDDFDGAGPVDQEVWRLPFSGGGAFLGRTELRTNRATDYPTLSGGTTRLPLDTFRDDGSGQSSGLFLGSELQTKRNFVVAGGLVFEIRCRLVAPVGGLVGGLVGGVFLFDVQRNNPFFGLVRDEIDFELISNDLDEVFTNFWNDGSFFGLDAAGIGVSHVPGGSFDLTEFQDYRIEWLPDRIDWYVNDQLVRSQMAGVPDDPMNLRLNMWAPDAGFANAFNVALQPASNSNQNQRFELELDRVAVTQINTRRSANMLVNSSFEDVANPPTNLNTAGNVDQSLPGQWFTFNNVLISTAEANTGARSLVAFGPFSGGADASGLFQNVAAAPGDVFEASVAGRTNFGDSINGQGNLSTLKIEFLDAQGDVMPGFEQFLGANGKESVILDGRDPQSPVGQWVPRQVNAVAPAGTVQARVTVLFVQLENGPGAVFLDDVQLVRLSEDSFLLGDVNDDQSVDFLDIASFIALLSGNEFLDQADIDRDGFVSFLDIGPFIVLLSN